MNEDTSSYLRVRERLEEIVVQIRSKDVPLEKSLDLYEEALRLGGIAAELIDNTDFTESELMTAELLHDELTQEPEYVQTEDVPDASSNTEIAETVNAEEAETVNDEEAASDREG